MNRDDATLTDVLGAEADVERDPPEAVHGTSGDRRDEQAAAVSASRGLMFVAALLIIVPAAIGLFILRSGATPAPPGAATEQNFTPPVAGDSSDGGITSADLLRPANAATGRIRYQADGVSANLANGGAIALAGGMDLHVSVSPFPPTDFTTDVALLLTDAAGNAVTDATISSDWDMVMVHGPFFTEFEHIGDGQYRAPSFDFFMFGPWQLNTTVTTPDGETIVKLAIFVWPE